MQRLALAALLLVALPFGVNPAQAGIYGVSFGHIRLVYDVHGDLGDPHTACNEYATDPILPFTEFRWYLVVEIDFADIGLGDQNASNGIQAWEAYVSIPDEITVTRGVLNPPSSINVGLPPPTDENDNNWIVGTGALVSANSTPFPVVEYTSLLLSDQKDLLLTILGADPSSFMEVGGPGEVPGWVEFNATGECDHECLRAFAEWDRCSDLLVNNTHQWGCECVCDCPPVGTTSWGAIKARF